jgi:phage protein D
MPVAKATDLRLPSFEISINGVALPVDAETQMIGVRVDDDVNLPSMFTLELTGSEHQAGESQWIDDPLFTLGNQVEIKMGYTDDLITLIVGEITGLEPEFTFNGLPKLTVRGYDRRHRLQRGRKTRTFVQKKDSDIAAQIASEAGLGEQTEDSQVVHDYVLQANQTDLEFLQMRAQRIQYQVVVEDKTLFFQPVANADNEIFTLTLEDDLLKFYPCLSSIGLVNEVTVRGWSFQDKKEIVGQAKKGDEVSMMGGQNSGATLVNSAFGSGIGNISNRPIMTQAEADQLAKAQFNQGLLALISGEGICRGRADLRAGKVIKIAGIGRQFSGQYYITAASHRYGPRGYYIYFTVRRNAV